MGIPLLVTNWRHIFKMKVFAIACLIVGAFAEPEAKPDADAYYYGNYGYNGASSLSYAVRPVFSSYGGYGLGSGAVGYAARPYVSSNGHASSTHSGYGAVGYTAHPCGGYGLRSFGKRSADAGPEAEADAYYYGNYGCNGYAARPHTSSNGYADRPYTSSNGYSARPLISSNGYAARPQPSTNGYAQQTYGGNGAVGYAARPYPGFSYGAFPSYG